MFKYLSIHSLAAEKERIWFISFWVGFFLCHHGYWSIHCLTTQENDFVKTVLVFPQLLFIPAMLTLVLGQWRRWHGLDTATWELLLFQRDVAWHAAPGTAKQPFRRHLSAKITWCHKVPQAGQFLMAWAGDLVIQKAFKKKSSHRLKIKASFFQISKACCGSDQLKQLPLSLPETTAVSTTQSGHCYQRQIWKS